MPASLSRRLEALETHERRVETKGNGYAPESWSRLAPWAIAVYHAGGWDAALALVRAGKPLPGYTPMQGGITWDVCPYWQRGNTNQFPTRQQEHAVLWLIAACVGHLLDEGTPHRLITSWETGRAIWEYINQEIGAIDAQPT
jgi:hypothetical protein